MQPSLGPVNQQTDAELVNWVIIGRQVETPKS